MGIVKRLGTSLNTAPATRPGLRRIRRSSNPVRLLFIGVNPPPDGGLWVNDADPLLKKLLWVFRKLGWTSCRSPKQFRDDFRSNHFYFVHAVKCFNETKFPSGRAARYLIEVCSATHLSHELNEIRPERICVLGEVAVEALMHAVKHGGGQLPLTIPNDAAALGEEIHISPAGYDKPVPVLVTYFPRDKFLGRALLLCHLKRWAEAGFHQPLGVPR